MVAVLPGGWEYIPIAYDNYNSAWGDGCAVPRYPPAVPRRGRHALLARGSGRPCGWPGSLGTRPAACSLADRILAHRRPGVRLGFRHRWGHLRLLPCLESLTTRSDRSPQVRVTLHFTLSDARLSFRLSTLNVRRDTRIRPLTLRELLEQVPSASAIAARAPH